MYSTENSGRQLFHRVAVSDLLMCTDLIDQFDLSSFQFSKKIEQSGDTIFCDMIDGGASWGIRLGASNPIIPIHPGRTIRRYFKYFTIYSTQPAPTFSSPGGNGDLQETVISLYVSRGLLIHDAQPRERGFGSRTTGRTNCAATTASRLILADYNNPGGFPNNANIVQWKPGRFGATLMIRNVAPPEGPYNTLYIAQQSSQFLAPVLETEMWRLYSGETLTIDLDGSIQQAFNQSKIIGSPDVGFVIYTKAGTAKYDWMISRLDCDPAPTSNKSNTGLNLG